MNTQHLIVETDTNLPIRYMLGMYNCELDCNFHSLIKEFE